MYPSILSTKQETFHIPAQNNSAGAPTDPGAQSVPLPPKNKPCFRPSWQLYDSDASIFCWTWASFAVMRAVTST